MSAATPGQTPLDHVVARVSKLHPSRIDLTLDRMQRILARLDHPERRLPPVIHVAGTNGKGSTVAYLRSILEAADLKVHVYTSPYLVRLNECVRLAGTLVGDDALRDALLLTVSVNLRAASNGVDPGEDGFARPPGVARFVDAKPALLKQIFGFVMIADLRDEKSVKPRTDLLDEEGGCG